MPQPDPAHTGTGLRPASAGHAGLAAARFNAGAVLGRDGFAIKSAAFDSGEDLDPSFTAQEEDSVAPPLEWSTPPAGALEMVLVVEDPSLSDREPACHWLVWGLAPQKGQLLEGEAPPRVGKNARGNSEWLLPDPPLGDPPHDYVFQLFALDTELTLLPGATRAEVFAAMDGHVIALAMLTGTFARSEDDEDDEEDWEG